MALCASCQSRRSSIDKARLPVPLPTGPPFDVLDWIATAHEQSTTADRTLTAAVTRARQSGASWSTIDAQLGVSRQAAQQRFTRASDSWNEVRDELSDALGSTDEQAQRREQLRRELALQRLVEMRKRTGLTQADVAERMGVSKARVSHIEHGAVATINLLARYLDAIGGRLEITAAFDGGTERVVLGWPAA